MKNLGKIISFALTIKLACRKNGKPGLEGEPDHQARGGLLYLAFVKSPAPADYMHISTGKFTKPLHYFLR